jgi:two-component system cell cycle sensor histidine kinase/response regulator CckA
MSKMTKQKTMDFHKTARRKFLELSLESTRKSYYPQLKEQLESAKENEKRLQLLIDNLPAQIAYINGDEKYILVNREFENAFDLTRDRIIGRTMEDVLESEIYHKVKAHIDKAMTGLSGRFEFSPHHIKKR